MKKSLHLLFSAYLKMVFILLILCCSKSQAAIRYVNSANLTPAAPYSNWSTAGTNLQAVINQCVAGDDIWVVAGTYMPNRRADATGTVTANDRDNAFVLKNGVRIFGGFNGTETATSQRNFALNITILSGDIGTAGNSTDNCYHVVVCAGTVTGTALNGFFIRYGNANGSGNITVNTISMGRGSGGGIRINSSSPTITNCVFSGNTTTNNGGGMVCDNASPAITNCVFSGNRANDGGAMLNTNASAPELINCTFAGNLASVTGGAIRNGNSSSPVIGNCIIWNNWVGLAADAIYNADAGSVPDVNYCVVQGGYAGTSNINSNPLFVNALSPLFAPTVVGDYRVQRCGPCINAGNSTYVPGSVNNDLDYTTRINYGVVDIGAYEMQLALAVPDAAGIVYVDVTKTGNGSSWTNAVADLADALIAAKFNTAIQQIWVAKGTYYPKYPQYFRPLLCNSPTIYSSFLLVDNLKVYGGFAGGETDTASRNYTANATVLSGDIGVLGDNTDNCQNVLKSFDVGSGSEFNGFTITKGNGVNGSGIANSNSDLIIENCIFSNNISTNDGGAMVNIFSAPVVKNCTFVSNTATARGGAICNPASSTVKIYNSVFASNKSGLGGGIANFNGSKIEMYNSRLILNESTNLGGGLLFEDDSDPSKIVDCVLSGNKSAVVGGGVCSHNASEFINCLVSGNKAQDGAGIHFRSAITGQYLVENCTIASNASGATGGALLIADHTAVVRNSIIFGNTGTTIIDGLANIEHSDVQGALYPGTGNINAIPLFINPQLASAAPTVVGDYHLQKCSPAINAGNNASIPPGTTKDLDTNNRIAFATVDMGAYEKHLAKPDANGIVYVDSSNSIAAGDGSSWAKSVTQLADALKEAKTNSDVKEIWVAKGTYKPIYNAADAYLNSICHTTDRDASFVMVPNLKLYGGFAGGETDTSGRDFVANETNLSGNIDNSNFNNGLNDAHHVMISAGAISTAALNGFTVRGGYATATGSISVNSQIVEKVRGGGLCNVSSSPFISGCKFLDNATGGTGAGLYNNNSSPLIANCMFLENTATQGGGIGNTSNSLPTITRCNFYKNVGGGVFNIGSSAAFISQCIFTENSTANRGAGIANESGSSSIITNCTFSKNIAASGGGGVYNSNCTPTIANCNFLGNAAEDGGGICNDFASSPIITNCIFSGNSVAKNGGGMANFSLTSTIPVIINCSFSGNKAVLNGGGIYSNTNSAPIIKNSILWGNTAASGNAIYPITGLPDVSNSIIQGGYASGTNILDLDPLFVSPQPAAAAPTTLGDYHLQPCSPALNLGDNSLIVAGVTKDLDSLDRIKYTTVDMGAYEMQTIDLATTTWRGLNTNWNDKINWCGGFVPYDTTSVIIPLTANNPLINAGFDNEVKNISLANNTSLGIASTGKITINGTYTNNGSTISNNGDWVMAGDSANQTFPGVLATVSAMKNLEVNNPSGLKFDKSFELTGTLTPISGNINLDNATVTLNSDATTTASVAAVPSGVAFSYTGTGKFEIERYIPQNRSWRLLTAPVSTVSNLTINQAWQEAVSNSNRLAPVNPSPGFGTTITKSTTYNVADGYDQGSTNTPSIRYFDGVNWGSFPSGTSGTTPGANNGLINDQPGYMLFIRGDRSIQVAGVGVPSTATTLRPKGQLKTGPQTIVCNRWTIIGNPYASPINFHKIVLDNPGLADIFYVWDSKLPGSNYVGSWVTYHSYNALTQTYTVTPTFSGTSFANNRGDISSGSAFGVFHTGTITINENHKSAFGENALFRPTRQLSMNLYVVDADSTESLNDGVAVKLDAASGAPNAEKNTNFTENLAIALDNKRYAVLNIQRPQFNDTIFIYSGQMKQRNYVLEIQADELNMPHQVKAFLEDTYLHRLKPVALEGSTRYAFTVNADSASVSAARFRLLFKKSAKFKHIYAAVKEKDIEVLWEMEENFGIDRYEIERSIDGIDFFLMGNQSTASQQQALMWLDLSPEKSTYYYRIKATCMDGEVLYSGIAKACMVNNEAGMYVYPNPVTGSTLQLRMNKQPEGQYSAILINSNGQKLFAQQWQHSGGFVNKIFELPSVTSAGIYQLEITKATGKKEVLAVEIRR